jgi:acetyltransferase-like isoleucine patch superfamily enzyme
MNKKIKEYYGKMYFCLRVNFFRFIYLNFFSSKIAREKRKFLIPLWNSKISIHRTAKIILRDHLICNDNKLPFSSAECYLELGRNSRMEILGKVSLFYNGTIKIFKNGELIIGKCTIQSGAVVACAYKLKIGQGCLLSRMSYISDSDHHIVIDDEGNITNWPRETIIGDNVWCCVKSTIKKGARVGSGSVISVNTVVGGMIAENSLVIENHPDVSRKIYWSEASFPDEVKYD